MLRKISKSYRGVSTVVGTVMFMSIALFMMGGLIFWTTQKQYAMKSLDKDRMDEQVIVIATYDEDFVPQAELHNIGSIEAIIIHFWIINVDSSPLDSKSLDLDPPITLPVTMNPIPIESATINELLNQLDSPFDPEANSYIMRAVTERGNIASSYFQLEGPEWWLESPYPIVIMPGESSLVGTTLTLSVINKSPIDINVDMLICTKIVTGDLGQSSTKVEIQYISWTIQSEQQSSFVTQLESSTIYGGDGLIVDLVSGYNWVVGSYIFIWV